MRDTTKGPEKLTILCSTDALDRAFLVFMLANAARSMGLDVTIFFALWGVNLLRRSKGQPAMVAEGQPPTERGVMERMMGMMMPRGPLRTGLSKMNFGGMGGPMMRMMMRKKKLSGLDELMSMSVELGVNFTVCSMTMDLMGFGAEDLVALPNTEFAGVASCLGSAMDSKLFLVI